MTDSATVTRFTDPAWWDAYWKGLKLPTEITKSENLLIADLTDVFDLYLTGGPELDVLEIGGSSGRYLAYLYRRLGCRVHVLESSPVGCEAARRNFELLGIPGTVQFGDMFDESLSLGSMDVVYSLGLIEHFDDPSAVARAHLRLLKPGGLLIIGAPNLAGINRHLFNWLSPSVFESHDAHSADPESWSKFESELGLITLFKSFIGGFEPTMFWRVDRDRGLEKAAALALKQLGRVVNAPSTRFLRRFNHRAWSAYAIAVYRVPATGSRSA
jgi:SAM-dependent methyltransferase